MTHSSLLSSWKLISIISAVIIITIFVYNNDTVIPVMYKLVPSVDTFLHHDAANECYNPVEHINISGSGHEYLDKVDIRIMVMSFDRDYSLQKCLDSLQNLELDGDTGAVEIWIDRSKQQSYDRKVLETARKFCWKHGPVRVYVHGRHVGIYGNWMRTWRPAIAPPGEKQELGIQLEDDVDLGKYTYRFLRKMHIFYGDRMDNAGYTLCDANPVYFKNDTLKQDFRNQGDDKIIYNYRILGTFGFAPHPTRWRQFQDWYIEKSHDPGFKPYVPEAPIHTGWYKGFEKKNREDSMWEMWFIKFTFEKDLFCLHNRLKQIYRKENARLAVGRQEQGLHQTHKLNNAKTATMMERWDDKYVKFNKEVNCYHLNGDVAKTL